MGLSGEWWIDDSGFGQYADGDVGDLNHETIAFFSALEVDPEDPRVTVIPGESISAAQARELKDLGANMKAVKFFRKGGSDARDYMMQTKNWIRVAGDCFQMWTFDDEALDRMKDFVDQEYPKDEDPLEDSFEVEELSTGKHWTIPGADLLESGEGAAALKFKAQRERPGWSNPPARRWRTEKGCIRGRSRHGSFMDVPKLLEEFGTTTYAPAAGFIMDDGTLIDLSGANQGGDPGTRARDHREVVCQSNEQVMGARSIIMGDFCEHHRAVRFGLRGNTAFAMFYAPPTRSQERALREIQRDFPDLIWTLEGLTREGDRWVGEISIELEPWEPIAAALEKIEEAL